MTPIAHSLTHLFNWPLRNARAVVALRTARGVVVGAAAGPAMDMFPEAMDGAKSIMSSTAASSLSIVGIGFLEVGP